jgi:hypothetical protein
VTDEALSRHLRPVEAERKGAKFAALDHDVARVLGPQRGAAVLYGFLASTWFEFADPQKLAERKEEDHAGRLGGGRLPTANGDQRDQREGVDHPLVADPRRRHVESGALRNHPLYS